jgi:hypothetical protein
VRTDLVSLALLVTFGVVSLLLTPSLVRQRKRREAATIQIQAIKHAVILGFGYFQARTELQDEIDQAAHSAQQHSVSTQANPSSTGSVGSTGVGSAAPPFARQRRRAS